MKKIRKITKGTSNTLLVNLKGFLPTYWEYVEVERVEELSNSITLKFTVLTIEQEKPFTEDE